MTKRSDEFALMLQDLCRRWSPKNREHDFRVDLDRLIDAAFVVAQESFVQELEIRRDLAIKSTSLPHNLEDDM